MKDLGCYCEMEVKCGLKQADCWLLENDYAIPGSHNTRWR